MTWNTDKFNQLLAKPLKPIVLRVFFFLALNQHEQTGFVRTTKKYLAQMLGIDPKSLYSALKFLIANYLVHQRRCSGFYEFMVSPYYVEWGDNKKARLDEWNRRWAQTWKYKSRKKM